ncbi:7-beta-(4-carbaxybutanamido)cephalosporanic acid acylase [Dulcicalothrix desertica PCC 7102]|uniref:7-beta-(4-carbaxybutanamido)cephalosporanic acid acylase n=1 Tax=Dulcicalothrix desertica PCC 7102 TaxID=232991 RepID=A0A3S1CMW0_9CYAN|nr:acylase [Dulcicalothrix desertica]RUS95277.1 7-beta-(4-carbaxybutanamido)cephalosporanic acid acylase [Dulcicalothrix desertica PCC 7102]
MIFSFILTLLVGSYNPTFGLRTTEILWDTYGIPHVYGKDAQSAFYAFGWAQMQSHGNLILRLYGQARGRAGEYFGEKYLKSDQWVRTMGIPVRARSWYNAQNPKFRQYLDAFAAGINTYAQQHADQIDEEAKAVLPINGVDLLAHTQRVLNFTFVVDPRDLAGISDKAPSVGSNGWAIAPAHSASGNAMLLANPHLPWSNLFLWYETHLTAPGINTYGAALVGVPVLAIAFNDYLGWTHTVNTHDGWDAYELTLSDGGYRFDGKVKAFETEEQILKVKQNDATLRSEKLVVKRSIHGPVIKGKDNKTVALRVVGLDHPNVLEQWWDMGRATNLTEFETALKRLQLPMFTVLYADREGHIMHLFNGLVPVHSQGDFEYWSGIVPGNTSTTLWTKTHPYHDLPRVLDPPSGWLQNANDPPWTTTFPQVLNPDKYPSYMAPRSPMSFRAQRSAKMLAEDEQISFQEMIKYKHSTRMELADRLLDELIPVARESNNSLVRRAADVLQTWDRQADANSRGAVLFSFWVNKIDLDESFAIPWNEKSPLTTPDGLADPKNAVTALNAAATIVEKSYGALDVPWGEVFRLRYQKIDLPANGGDGNLGIFRVLDFAPTSDGRFAPLEGDSYVAAIEFSNPVKAMALTSYGNATQPKSQHIGDQLKLFARKELRQVLRTRQEIQANLVKREVL